MERKILSSLLYSREAFETLEPFLSPEDLSDQGGVLYEQINQFYHTDPDAQVVDKEILNARIQRDYPKHADRLVAVVDSLEEVSEQNVVKEYIDLKVEDTGYRLANALFSRDQHQIQEALEEYNRWLSATDLEEEDEEVLQGTSLADLSNKASDDQKIKVLPHELNNVLDGGLPPESHVLIYAPPEVGKSLFSINMACGFLYQQKKVLYIGNEDPSANMLFRFYSCLSGMTKQEMLRNMDEAQRLADERGYQNLTFISQEGGTVAKLQDQVKRHQPDVVFVDQIGNFHVKNKEGAQALEHIARGVRGVAKKHGIVGVSVHQGDAAAQGKLFLDLGDVYYSNVGVQGAVDVMIGIGATKDMLNGPQRMLNLTKNKLSGIHDPVEVSFNPQLSRVQ